MPRLLLACGILEPIVYIAGDLGMTAAYPGYSYFHQTVSELNAIGAPTRGLSVGLGIAESVLLILFGAGIWLVARDDRKLPIVGATLISLGALGIWAVQYASMQLRGARQEGPHLLSGAIGALLVITAIGVAALAFRTRFRYYSLATIVVMVLFAAWGMKDAGRIEAGLATPWVGVIERVSFYSWHVWFLALALAVRRYEPTPQTHSP